MSQPRTFEVRSGTKSQRTPAPLFVTRRGQLPNLPMQLASKVIPSNETLLLSFPLYDWYMMNPNANKDMCDLLSTLQTSLSEFTSQKDAILFLTSRAAGSVQTLSENAGKSTVVRVCESSGMKITQQAAAKLYRVVRTDFVVAPTDAPFYGRCQARGGQRKRAERSIEQMKDFLNCVRFDGAKQNVDSIEHSCIFASVQGGVGIVEERRKVAGASENTNSGSRKEEEEEEGSKVSDPNLLKDIVITKNLRKDCATAAVNLMKTSISESDGSKMQSISVSIDGLYAGESCVERHEAMKSVMESICKDNSESMRRGLRLLSGGTGTPWDVLNAVGLGIDIIDSSFPFDMAENGFATRLCFNEEHLNLRDRKWEICTEAVVQGCSCFVCKGFSKAYIRHLLEVHEMMGVTFLAAHNVWDYLNWFKQLRQAIDTNSFQHFVEQFQMQQRQQPHHHVVKMGQAKNGGDNVANK